MQQSVVIPRTLCVWKRWFCDAHTVSAALRIILNNLHTLKTHVYIRIRMLAVCWGHVQSDKNTFDIMAPALPFDAIRSTAEEHLKGLTANTNHKNVRSQPCLPRCDELGILFDDFPTPQEFYLPHSIQSKKVDAFCLHDVFFYFNLDSGV